MHHYPARIREIYLDNDQDTSALIECSQALLPDPGQYFQAWSENDPDPLLPISLFPSHRWDSTADLSDHLLYASATIPKSWQPGDQLFLRGPLGRGFQLPTAVRKIGVVALGSSLTRLLPLLEQALHLGAEVALFFARVAENLPAAVEINPLAELADALTWADFLAMDCPAEKLPDLRELLGIRSASPLALPAQILIYTPMPCGCLAQCGVCAVPSKGGYKLACQDGPVFDLGDLIY